MSENFTVQITSRREAIPAAFFALISCVSIGRPMLDANPARLIRHGRIVMDSERIEIDGFEGEGTSCRDVAALALCWAIAELQRELQATLERPGGTGKAAMI